jgi:phospholipase D1/2
VATTAWKDLNRSLEQAEKFIYITGWSVYTAINLVRGDDDPEGNSNVGELLKRKSEEGLKVVVVVWDEKLSTDRVDGVMCTHDNDTRDGIH